MNKYVRQLATSNWIITLSATLLGVFLALYLNEQVASRKLNKQKTIALDNLSSEISENKKSLKKSIFNHTLLLDIFTFIKTYKTEDDDYVISIDTLNAFRKKYPNIISMTDSIQIDSSTYKYIHGEFNTNFDFLQIALTSITLETLKNSDLITSYNFECLMFIESLIKLTKEVRRQDTELFNLVIHSDEMKTKQYDQIIKNLKILIQYEKVLMGAYDENEKTLLDCN